jgi:hypothetical protein
MPMILNVSERGGNAMLGALSELMDGGSIELLSGNGVVLAVMKLSDPAARDASGGEIELNKITEGIATAAGRAETARILSPNGGEVLLCDVGGPDSDAVIKLTTTAINKGGPVRLTSFRIVMP